MLGKAGNIRISKGSKSRIMLIVVFQGQHVFSVNDIIQIADGLIRNEISAGNYKGVLGEVQTRCNAIIVRNEVLPVRELILKYGQRNWIDLARPNIGISIRRVEILIRN